jgi:hypothetical protein
MGTEQNLIEPGRLSGLPNRIIISFPCDKNKFPRDENEF